MRILYWFSFNLRIWSTIVKMQSRWATAHYMGTQPTWAMVCVSCALVCIIEAHFYFGCMWIHEITHEAKDHNLFTLLPVEMCALQVIFRNEFFNMSCVSISKICEMNNFHSTGIKYVMAQYTENTRRTIPKYSPRKEREKNQWEMVSTQSF